MKSFSDYINNKTVVDCLGYASIKEDDSEVNEFFHSYAEFNLDTLSERVSTKKNWDNSPIGNIPRVNVSNKRDADNIKFGLAVLKSHDDLNAEHEAETKKSLKDYTQNSRIHNMQLLRLDTMPKSKASAVTTKKINRVSQATNNPKNALSKSLMVYSGVRRGATSGDFKTALKEMKPGGLMRFPGFTSTSLSSKYATTFSLEGVDDAFAHMLAFRLPRGYTKARYVSDKYSVYDNELEVILDKGQTFKKLGHAPHPDYPNTTIHYFEPV